MTSTPLLQAKYLDIGHRQSLMSEPLNLDVHAGECIGILGPNGSGKTTLLHTLRGLSAPRSGHIELLGKPLADWQSAQLAQKLGIVFQTTADEMPATVLEAVELGRLPHQSAWRSQNSLDLTQVWQALSAMQLTALAHRELSSLSGGERQRVAIAMLLAQAPQICLLDEPSNHLDISFQIKTLQLLRDFVQGGEHAMLITTHDINLAARFCDRILLLGENGTHLLGNVDEILTETNLSNAFLFKVRRLESDGQICFMPAEIVSRQ